MPKLPHFFEVRDLTGPLERLRELAGMHLEYARALGGNPRTPPALLEELAHRPEKGIRRALTGNPSTPETLLFKLACAFPAEFLKNPLLSLLALEDPDFAAKLPAPTRRALAKHPGTPPEMLEGLVQPFDAAVRLALFANPSAPLPLLKRFRPYYQAEDSEDRFKPPNREGGPEAQILHALETPFALTAVKPELARLLLALEPVLKLRPRERAALGAVLNPTPAGERLTPPELLGRLLEASSPAAPLNGTELPSVLTELRDPATSSERLLELWKHASLRPEIAAHPQASLGFVLTWLSQASDPAVRWLSLRSSELPRPALARFLRSVRWKERLATVVHPRATYRMLRVLVLDPQALVANKALERLRVEHGENPVRAGDVTSPTLEKVQNPFSSWLRRLFGRWGS